MKHLKSYKLFESVDSTSGLPKESIIEDIKEIFASEIEYKEFPSVDMYGKNTNEMTTPIIVTGGSTECWTDNSDLEIIPVSIENDPTGYGMRPMKRCKIEYLKDFIVRLLEYKEQQSLNINIHTVSPKSHEDVSITLENLERLCQKGMVICSLAIKVEVPLEPELQTVPAYPTQE